jgi:hypothetical protein
MKLKGISNILFKIHDYERVIVWFLKFVEKETKSQNH